MAYLDLVNLSKSFNQTVAVEGFSMEVTRGEFVSFLGPSGCGKTTTLRMVAGFELPSSGTIVVNGNDITRTPPNQRNVGMVFQSYALFPNMNVEQNVGFGLTVGKMAEADKKQRVGEMLDLTHLSGFNNRYPYQLSGGQQQRVALARALAIRPQVLLLDEPLSALDAKIRLELRTEIRRIQQEMGITTIYVTHDQEEALSLSDRVVVMNRGRIEQIGTPLEIYNRPQTHFVASFVGTLNVLAAVVRDPAAALVAVEGQEITAGHPLPDTHKGQTVQLALRPENLSFDPAVPGANLLHGRVQHVTFLGSIVRIQVDLGAQTVALDAFNHPHLRLPATGQELTVSFPRESCLLLEEAYAPS